MININVEAICPDKVVKIHEFDSSLWTKPSPQIKSKGVSGKVNFKISAEKIKSEMERLELANLFPEEQCKLFPAVVAKRENESEYHIGVNLTVAMQIYRKSWVKDIVSFDVIKAALILHELSHIRYSNFESSPFDSSEFLHMIENILEDTRIEYLMSLEFPETSIFFNLLLSATNREVNVKDNSLSSPEEELEMKKRIDELFFLARYNLMEKGCNKEFVGEILPLVLMARRGSINDMRLSTEIIANIIKDDTLEFDTEMQNGSISESMQPITKEDKDELMELFEGDEGTEQIAEKFFGEQSVKDQAKAIISGSKAGENSVIENKQRTSFFIETANKRRKEIDMLHNVFKKVFTSHKDVDVKEGDIDFKKQQQAYMNSITGEEGTTYKYRKLERVLVDVVLIRDVSSSTNQFKVEYAEALVVLLSSLESISGIRTAQIDFNGSHHTNKTFDTSMETATINPFADGGTSIKGALNEVLSYNFKGKKNIVMIFSDGDFFDNRNEVEALEKKIKEVATIVKFGVGNYRGSGFKPITIDNMPKEIMDVIIKEGLA